MVKRLIPDGGFRAIVPSGDQKEGENSVIKAVTGTAESITESHAVGFDAVHTLSANAILAGVAQDDPFSCALIRLNPQFDETVMANDEADFSSELVRAKAEIANGGLDRAAARLMPFLSIEAASAPVLSTLAAGCLAAQRVGDAIALIERCLEGAPLYPPALRVAGEAELARGNRKVAKAFLAKAARIARKMPEHLEDMRAAQRLLLQLQFG